jgi:hypothetical protein
MSDSEKIDLDALFQEAKKDPSLFSTLDINKLLESIDDIKNDYLDNKTMANINEEIYNIINDLGLETDRIENLCNKLIGYRYVDTINELHKGKHIRWIRIADNNLVRQIPTELIKLTAGGILTNVKFLDNGTHIMCMGPGNRFIQYKFDECLTFQKLTVEEQLILMATPV